MGNAFLQFLREQKRLARHAVTRPALKYSGQAVNLWNLGKTSGLRPQAPAATWQQASGPVESLFRFSFLSLIAGFIAALGYLSVPDAAESIFSPNLIISSFSQACGILFDLAAPQLR